MEKNSNYTKHRRISHVSTAKVWLTTKIKLSISLIILNYLFVCLTEMHVTEDITSKELELENYALEQCCSKN